MLIAVGQPAPEFTLKDQDQKDIKLSDYRGKIVMLHFWSATCPFVFRYDERLTQIANDYLGRVVVLGIDSNSNESPDQMKEIAQKRKVPYPILVDKGNKVADQFGAITTPHVFLIDQNGKLAYEGAVDDQGWSEDNPVKVHYVREALDAILSDSKVSHPQTKSVGCTVKRAF